MLDLITGLVAVLKAQSGVAALVSTRVYPHEWPDGLERGPDAPKLITVREDGQGERAVNSPVMAFNVECACFGANYGEATAVARAVSDALHGARNVIVGGKRWIGFFVDPAATQRVDPEKWRVSVLRLRGYVALNQ